MIRIKICGNTSVEDARLAASLGADAIGLIFHDESPRGINIDRAREIVSSLPPFLVTVGVFVNQLPERVQEIRHAVSLDYIQLHGDEDVSWLALFDGAVLKALRIASEQELDQIDQWAEARGLLLDTPGTGVYGGSGVTGNWQLAAKAVDRACRADAPILLAGGLSPENVGDAIRQVRPYGVDVVSGVEAAPGRKDPEKLRRFIEAARAAGAALDSNHT